MRFLFCVLGSPGYVYPAIGIALQLRATGHNVAFATVPAYGSPLKAQGFERIAFPEGDNTGFRVSPWAGTETLRAQLAHTRRALRIFKPDVVVTSQLAIAPMALCAHERRCFAVLGFAMFPFPASTLMLREPGSPIETGHAYRLNTLAEQYLEACRLAGFEDSTGDVRVVEKSPLFGRNCLIQSVPEMTRARLAPQVRLVGSCLWEPPERDYVLEEWLRIEPDLPLIYVQQGRTFDDPAFWPHLVAATRDRPVRIAASTSRMDNQGAIPSARHFFVRPHVPQGQVLPFARAVICSATTTPVLGAITHGVPCLLIPGGSAEPELARECEEAEAGVTLQPADTNPESFWQAIDHLISDPGLQAGAKALGAAFARIDGHGEAARLLASLECPGIDVQCG